MSIRNCIAVGLVALASVAFAQQPPPHPYALPLNPNVPPNFSWQQLPGAGYDIGAYEYVVASASGSDAGVDPPTSDPEPPVARSGCSAARGNGLALGVALVFIIGKRRRPSS